MKLTLSHVQQDTQNKVIVLYLMKLTLSHVQQNTHNKAIALYLMKLTPSHVQQDTHNKAIALYLMKLTLSQNSSHRILGKPNYYVLTLVLQPPTRTSTLRSDGSYKSIQGSAV
jgi:hypothetical protein